MTEPEKPMTRNEVADAVENRREFLAADVESTREERELGVETIREIREGKVEVTRAELAKEVEAERSDREVDVEVKRKARAGEAEVTRAELAKILEADRKAHNLRVAEALRNRTRTINRRFAFLFGLLFVVFGLLAYRSEVNTRDIEDGFRQACQQRAALAQTYNDSNTGFPPLPVEACTGEEQPQ